jgi:hypothetical protein
LPNFGKDVFPKLNPNDIKELPIAKADKKSKEKILSVIRLNCNQKYLIN